MKPSKRHSKGRLIVVANRLPYALQQEKGKGWRAVPAPGGLVTAMEPVLRRQGGVWIGWPGTTEKVPQISTLLDGATKNAGFKAVAVTLSEAERDEFYYGYSNEIIWPLFHDLQSHCNFDPAYWCTYESVNAKFAEAIFRQARANDFVWVHDYQLMNVARSLREKGFKGKVAFFLHIPFPSLDIFTKLPKQQRLLQGLLQYDMLGFQTRRDEMNFLGCVRRLAGGATVHAREHLHEVHWNGRVIRTGSFPIGIDYEEFCGKAALPEVARRAWNIHAGLPDRQLILGVDRLDYTKGIPDRLRGFSNALKRYPALRRKVTFIQAVVPSRTDIPKYHVLRTEIERLVGHINGQFSIGNWIPIHYLFRSLEHEDLLAYYRTAEIALVTPHKDGMNLVAKEYCACSLEENCVLILSQFAGAADQLGKGSLLINPYDIEGLGDAIYQAYTMPPAERRARMQKLRANVKKENVYWWVDSFLQAATAK